MLIHGSDGFRRKQCRRAWVRAGNLKPSFLITHRFTLDESEQAIATLRGDVADDEPRGKVVIVVTQLAQAFTVPGASRDE